MAVKTARSYQLDGINLIKAAFRSYKKVLYVLPTGGGKTFVFSLIAIGAALKNKTVLVLAHRVELLNQAQNSLPQGVIVHSVFKPYKGKTPDLIIVDEAHHTLAGSWLKILNQFPDTYVLGVTATPCRTDGKGLGDFYQSMIVGPNVAELIEMGYLSSYVHYVPTIDEPSAKSQSGLDKWVFDRPEIVGDAVLEYSKRANGKPTVAFCCNKKHAETVADKFRAAGYKTLAVTADTPKEERQAAIDGLGNGELQVLCACDIVSEGTDIPQIECAILLRRTASLSLYIQQIGRALRIAEGKAEAIILDMVANAGRWIDYKGKKTFLLRHGFADTEREWDLAKGIVKACKETTMPITQCPNCYVWFKPKPQCPNCGQTAEVKERKIAYTEGDLEAAKAKDALSAIDLKKAEKREEGRCQTLEDWLALAKRRGYNEKWAYLRFKIRNSAK